MPSNKSRKAMKNISHRNSSKRSAKKRRSVNNNNISVVDKQVVTSYSDVKDIQHSTSNQDEDTERGEHVSSKEDVQKEDKNAGDVQYGQEHPEDEEERVKTEDQADEELNSEKRRSCESPNPQVEEKVISESHPHDLEIKHPLKDSWTLWYNANDPNKDWEENLRAVYTVSTVEDFWALYNFTSRASELRVGTDYALFKEGIRPMWEDKANAAGGRWYVSLEKKYRYSLDLRWMNILLLMIGNTMRNELSDVMNGIMLNVKHKADKISLWLSISDTKNSFEAIKEIGLTFKHVVGVDSKEYGREQLVYFESHASQRRRQGSLSKGIMKL